MSRNGEVRKETQEDRTLDQLIEQYLQDPESLALEAQRSVYQHFLEQVEATSPEADTLREAIEKLGQDLERAKQGDPQYLMTPEGTFYKRDVEMKKVPVEQLIADPAYQDLFRDMEGEDFEQLKASIQEIGLIEPIVVDPKLRVICGHQRLRAALAIGLAHVPVLIRSVDREEMRAILAIEENIRRRQLQPSEMARAVKKLVELKEKKNKVKQVAREIGLSKTQVYLYRDLSHLIPEIASLLDRGKLTQETAIRVAQLDEDVQRVLYQALGERISEQKIEEFKRANADLLHQMEKLNGEMKRREQRQAELEAENSRLQELRDRAEFKAGDELKQRQRLEEELQKNRAESYQQLQEKQAVIDKLSKNVEPKVVPPPDYEVIKKELKQLKAKRTRPAEVVMTELYGILSGQVLSVDPEDFKGKLPLSVRELFYPLMPKIKIWLAHLEELIGSPPAKPEIRSARKDIIPKERRSTHATGRKE